MTRMWFVTLVVCVSLAWTDFAGLRWWGIVGTALAAFVVVLKARSVLRRRAARRTIAGLRELHPVQFEVEVGRWLRRDGWRIEHRGGTGDGGIDIFASRRGEGVAIQCKRYAETAAVSASQVRDLYGAAIASGASAAVLVTTGRISAPALAWAESLPPGPEFRFHDSDCLPRLARGRARV